MGAALDGAAPYLYKSPMSGIPQMNPRGMGLREASVIAAGGTQVGTGRKRHSHIHGGVNMNLLDAKIRLEEAMVRLTDELGKAQHALAEKPDNMQAQEDVRAIHTQIAAIKANAIAQGITLEPGKSHAVTKVATDSAPHPPEGEPSPAGLGRPLDEKLNAQPPRPPSANSAEAMADAMKTEFPDLAGAIEAIMKEDVPAAVKKAKLKALK